MQVQLPGGLSSLTKKVFHKNESKPQLETTKPIKSDSLSFMSIPSIAFAGKLVVPNLPKGLNAQPKPVISKGNENYFKETEAAPTLEYKVIPQDPLVTKPEIVKHKGVVVPGPESSRVKTLDKSEVAKPDANGNYIEDVNKPQFDRVNAFLFTQKVLDRYEDALGRKIEWAFPSQQLKVNPLAGVTMNAYYSRWDQETKFFYFQNRFDQDETCYTSKMADVVAHETGHATLDGLRPSYIGWGSHGGAIHEGFSDTTSMLVAMDHDSVLDAVIKQTGGDLKKENLIASLAEQFGKAVYGDKMYLRNAINDLKLSDFTSGRESQQVHNFGRLAAGTFYDVIVEMTMQNAKDMPLKDALKQTNKDMTKMLIRAMGDFSPPGNVYYPDIAKALIKAEQADFNGKYKDAVRKAVIDRELIKPEEIKAFEAEQASLPAIKLPPKTMETTESILGFVNDNKAALKLPAENKYQLESAYTNKFGETFIQVKAPKEVVVPDADPYDPFGGENYKINLYDGLTLGFDKTGKLFYKAENKTESYEIMDAISDAQKALKKLEENTAKGLQPNVYKAADGSNTLIKAPVLEDPIGV